MLEKTNNKIKKYVPWHIFIWTMGIIFIVFGILFDIQNELSHKISSMETNNLEIRTQLSQIQADLAWIKKALK